MSRKTRRGRAAKARQTARSKTSATRGEGKRRPPLGKAKAEVLEFAGSRIERHGRNILFSSHRTPEQQTELLKHFRDQIPLLLNEINVEAGKIAQVLSRYNSFDLIAHVSMINLMNNPDTYKEYAHEGLAFCPEYVALLALKHAFVTGDAKPIPPQEIQTLDDAAKTVMYKTMFLQMASRVDPDRASKHGAIDQLSFIAATKELIVRNDAYQVHLHEILHGLFGPFEKESEAALGFSVEDATRLTKCLAALVCDRVTARVEQGKTLLGQLVTGLKAPGASPEFAAAIPPEWRDRMASKSPKTQRDAMSVVALSWVTYGLGTTYSVSAKELADYSGILVGRVEAFLRSLSIEFGGTDASFCIPTPVHSLKRSPLIHHASRYLCPSYSLLDSAIRPRIESALKATNTSTWNRYVKHRHRYLVERGVAAMKSVLPNAQSATELSYTTRGVDGPRDGEVDALLQADSVLFIIEGKAGGFTDPARSGKKRRLETHLKELVGNSFEQATKVGTYMRSTRWAEFSADNGRKRLRIDTATITVVIHVSLHLESLGHLTSLLHANESLGLFSGLGVPWMVNLADLLVITECVEYEAQLPHYINRRIRAAKQGFMSALDELDYFGFYLRQGLYFAGKRDDRACEFFSLMSHTTELDGYFLKQMGLRKRKASRPKQTIPRALRELLSALQQQQVEGYLDVSLAILDFGADGRKSMAENISTVRRRFARDGHLHDATQSTEAEGGSGLTYMCGSDASELTQRLGAYCLLKKHQAKADRWFGIADVGQKVHRIVAIARLMEPWAHDAEMDEILRSSGLPGSRGDDDR